MNRIIPITISTALILTAAYEESPKEPPVASFTVSPEIARVGDTIYFQNTSKNANTFEWDFGDGNGSTEENPSHIYTETGAYIIHLEVTNSDGYDEASRGLTITLWTTRTPMPTGRWVLATCVVNGKIYAIGGGSKYGHGALGTVEEYDPVTDTWSAKSEMPTARQELTASVVDGKIYAIGGGESPSNTSYRGVESYATVEEYDPATDTWTEKSPMPTARWCHSACVFERRIYIIGGCGSNSYPFSVSTSITSLEMYDPATDTWTQIGDIPRPMVNSGIAEVDGKIYVFGGEELSGNGQRVDEYNPLTGTWTQKANMPSARSDFGSSVLNEKIYTIGGDGGDDYTIFATLQVYDPAKDTWTTGTPMITPRLGLQSSTVDGKIYAIGGLTHLFSQASKKLEVYYE